MKSEGQA